MPTALQVVRKFFPNVKTVVDASRNARVEVTSKDERTANKKSHKTCAMAVACKRKFKLDGVIMSIGTTYLVKGTQARRFVTTSSVAREVVSFDRGAGFEPGDYELAKPEPSRRLDRPKRVGTGHGPSGRPAGNRRHMHRTGGIRVTLGSKMAAE